MILKLDLSKAYNSVNQDIAKKNKINKINLDLNEYSVSEDSYDGEISANTNTEDNTLESQVATAFSTVVNQQFSSYIGKVLYKEYTKSFDLTNPDYSYLKNVKIAPNITFSYNGKRYYRNMKNYLANRILSLQSYDIFKSRLENKDIVADMNNFVYTNTYGEEIDLWTDKFDFTKNEFKKTSQSQITNIYDEINATIQNGSLKTDKPNDFDSLKEYVNTSITKWVNDDTTLTITLRIPSEIYFWKSDSVYYTGEESFLESIYNTDSIDWFKYDINVSNILFLSLDESSSRVSYDYGGDREYNAEDSSFFSKGIFKIGTPYKIINDKIVYDYYYDKTFADKLNEEYKNGKSLLELTYPVTEVYDTFDYKVVYIDKYGIAKKIGSNYYSSDGKLLSVSNDNKITEKIIIPEGSICQILNNGENVFTNLDGSIKYFMVSSLNLEYDGILLNKLTLIEYNNFSTTGKFNESSWEEIDELGKLGKLQDTFNVGDIKYISVESQPNVKVPITILGFNHDMLANGLGVSGMTLGMSSVLIDKYKMNDSTKDLMSWADCDFRNTTIDTIIKLLPSDLTRAIKPVIKKSLTNNTSLSNYTNTNDTLFLQSITEIVGKENIDKNSWLSTYFGDKEGTQYEYWKSVKDGNNSEDRKKLDYNTMSKVDGEMQYVPVSWTTRSIQNSQIASFGDISNNGDIVSAGALTNNAGISFAFCVGQEDVDISNITTLDSATWKQINYISSIGLASSYFKIGDIKNVTLKNGESIQLVIIGFKHDTLQDGKSNAEITFAMKTSNNNLVSVINQTKTNVGGWEQCYLRNTTLNNLYNQLPDELVLAIKPIIKRTSNGGDSQQITLTTDKLWLLSEVEVTGNSDYSVSGEGIQYEYYKTEGNIDDSKFWLRSPYYNNNTSWNTMAYGNIGPQQSTINQYVYIFGFCL